MPFADAEQGGFFVGFLGCFRWRNLPGKLRIFGLGGGGGGFGCHFGLLDAAVAVVVDILYLFPGSSVWALCNSSAVLILGGDVLLFYNLFW